MIEMLPESRDKRVNYEVKMPRPPQPRRRGAMEFYEWITLILFIMSLSASTVLHLDIDTSDDTVSIGEGSGGFVPFPDAVTAFFFILLVVFDYNASRRYTKYSSQLLDQWQEDKIRLMKMYSEEQEKKAKRSEDDGAE